MMRHNARKALATEPVPCRIHTQEPRIQRPGLQALARSDRQGWHRSVQIAVM